MVELLTTIAMLGIGLTAAFFFYQSAVARTTDTEARVDTLAEQRVMIENISRESREAVRLVVRDSGGNVASSGGILDIYGVSGAASASREAIRYDCVSTPGTCTRATYAWDSGGYGDTVAVAPALAAPTSPATIEMDGLDPAIVPFSGAATPAGSPLTTFSVELQSLPEGRDRPIRLTREITARNVCIYAATDPAPEAAACGG